MISPHIKDSASFRLRPNNQYSRKLPRSSFVPKIQRERILWFKKKKKIRYPGLEPGSAGWKPAILTT